MKRNNVAKRFGIASLCLATALSAFSGIAPQTNSVALAEGEVALTDFVHTTTENVEQTTEKTASDGSTTTKGLRLTSDVAYEGTFKTVFKGDTKLNFKFPEEFDSTNREYYGDFRIRVADVDDQSNYFDVVYYTITNGSNTDKPYTGVYVEHTVDGHKLIRSNHYQNTTSKPTQTNWYNKTAATANGQASIPCFRSFSQTGNYAYAVGSLTLNWEGDVLSVMRRGFNNSLGTLVAFDGTYSETATNYGYVNKSKWGLPKMNFENGYTISYSSDITTYYVAGKKSTTHVTTDEGTDVLFTSIGTNGTMEANKDSGTFDTIYRFNQDTTTIPVDDNMTQFSNTFAVEPTTEAGEVFLGWKNADGLHATPSGAMAHDLFRKSEYEAVTIGYDTIDGASVRIDVSGGESGIRFMTTFDKNDYAAVKDYITEKGTLVAVRTALDAEKDFTIANYQEQIDDVANGKVKKVVNTKPVFDYTAANSTTYTAYSMAITFNNIAEELLANYYTTVYSARGYLVVEYADGSTATIYTDYDADKNSRSIAQTAYNIRQANTEYASYGDDQKAIVDTYAGYYNAN